MEKIIIEVGSTVTKVDKYNGEILKRLEEKTIFFKKNYLDNKRILDKDIKLLVGIINKYIKNYKDIYVCGTSIFRSLNDEEFNIFNEQIKENTGCEFHVITEDDESRLTVLGVTKNIDKACVMIAGGGSTEIAIYDKEIKNTYNTSMGVIDILKEFPDLSHDLASSSLEEVMVYVKKHLNLPTEKCDILILAGGAHERFARESGIKYEDNTLYIDKSEPIMMDINTRILETKRYFKEISLDDIRGKSSDPSWWDATRAMCAMILVIALAIDAKYIIPTDIGMAYGIVNK